MKLVDQEPEKDNVIETDLKPAEVSEKEISGKLLQGVTSSDLLKDDESLVASDTQSMLLHNKAYTSILRAYEVNVDKNLKAKRRYKSIFFYLICAVLALIASLTIAVVILGIAGVISAKNENIGIYVTALGSFLSSFLILPKVVAKYLFNREEETKVADIVRTMQSYDTDIRSGGKQPPKD